MVKLYYSVKFSRFPSTRHVAKSINFQRPQCFNKRHYEGRNCTFKEVEQWTVPVYDEKFIIVKMASFIAQTTLRCSVVTLVLCSSQRSEARSAQCKTCSDILLCGRSRTSGRSIVFRTLTLVQAILLHAPFKFNSRIFIRNLWAPCFVISTGQVYVFMGHNTAGFLWTIIFYLPWDPSLNST